MGLRSRCFVTARIFQSIETDLLARTTNMLGGKGKGGNNGGAPVDAPPQGNVTPPAAQHAAPPVDAATSAANITAAANKSIASTAQHQQFAALFSQAVAVLMRDNNYKNMPLRELEHLLPPIMVGQCAIANTKAGADGPLVPVALALWAKVSPEIDKRLGENLDKPVGLRPNEWTSGNIPWLVTIAGASQVLAPFLKQLCEKEFPGLPVKLRASDEAGVRSVQILPPSTPAAV
jgi:hemolysin-activating ACP:hemolysin acyltransferase